MPNLAQVKELMGNIGEKTTVEYHADCWGSDYLELPIIDFYGQLVKLGFNSNNMIVQDNQLIDDMGNLVLREKQNITETQFEKILDSYFHNQCSQMVNQIKKYGLCAFWSDFRDYISNNYPRLKNDHFMEITILYFQVEENTEGI